MKKNILLIIFFTTHTLQFQVSAETKEYPLVETYPLIAVASFASQCAVSSEETKQFFALAKLDESKIQSLCKLILDDNSFKPYFDENEKDYCEKFADKNFRKKDELFYSFPSLCISSAYCKYMYSLLKNKNQTLYLNEMSNFFKLFKEMENYNPKETNNTELIRLSAEYGTYCIQVRINALIPQT